jgi:hypothetical protein
MKLLLNLFTLNSNTLDPRIQKSLFSAANSLIHGSELSLTAMGRNSARLNQSSEKHSIKRVDRLLGNQRLQSNRCLYYKLIATQFITGSQPLIHVDWSTVYNYDFVMLRAAISIKGRAVTIYEEVHPEEKHANHQVHKSFIANLKSVLPEGCRPIICTDAGFKIPWFKEVEIQGWYWLARTRGTVKCQIKGLIDWPFVQEYHQLALPIASELKDVKLSKSHKFSCRGVLFKGKNMQRHNLNRKGVTTKCATNIKHAKSAREPWFLVTNLPSDKFRPNHLVNLYKRRMSIEESFRDCKNEYYGLGLSRSLSRSIDRLQVILLLSMMVQFYLYCVGKAAETEGYHRDFQANSVRHKRVLSYGYLALCVLQHERYKLSEKALKAAMEALIKDSYIE